MVGFGFTSDWLRKRRAFFEPITKRSKNKQTEQTQNSFDTQARTALYESEQSYIKRFSSLCIMANHKDANKPVSQSKHEANTYDRHKARENVRERVTNYLRHKGKIALTSKLTIDNINTTKFWQLLQITASTVFIRLSAQPRISDHLE